MSLCSHCGALNEDGRSTCVACGHGDLHEGTPLLRSVLLLAASIRPNALSDDRQLEAFVRDASPQLAENSLLMSALGDAHRSSGLIGGGAFVRARAHDAIASGHYPYPPDVVDEVVDALAAASRRLSDPRGFAKDPRFGKVGAAARAGTQPQPQIMTPPSGARRGGLWLNVGRVALIAAVVLLLIGAGVFASGFFGAHGDTQQMEEKQDATRPESTSKIERMQDEPQKETEAEQTSATQTEMEPQEEPEAEAEAEPQPEPDPAPQTEEVTPTAETSLPPVFGTAESSSELPGDSITAYYGPYNACDGDLTTAWSEGAAGGGVGEWLRLTAAEDQTVRGVRIVNGYPKSGEVYRKNGRCRDVTFILSDGYECHTTLLDSYREYQTITFDGPHQTHFLQMRIDSIYAGDSWDDTLVCELEAF